MSGFNIFTISPASAWVVLKLRYLLESSEEMIQKCFLVPDLSGLTESESLRKKPGIAMLTIFPVDSIVQVLFFQS